MGILMSNNIPQSVLSDALKNVLNGRKVKCAVFLTYMFDPGFFELYVLPLLFDRTFGQEDNIKRALLDDAIRDIEDIAIFYDYNGLVSESEPATLNYNRFSLRRNGIFHPKNIFLLIENKSEDGEEEFCDSLIVGTISANLTQAGWWYNVESAHFHEYIEEDAYLEKDNLISYLKMLQKSIKTDENILALDNILKFLRTLSQRQQASSNGKYFSKFYNSKMDFNEFIYQCIRPHISECNLEIISPYHQNSSDPSLLKDLTTDPAPVETRIFLPMEDMNTIAIKKEYYDSVSSLKNIHWSTLPKDILNDTGSNSENDRFVHAKVFRFFNKEKKWDFQFIGSVNFTQAAFQSVKGNNSNIESAVFVDCSDNKIEPQWWLKKLKNEEIPKEFIEEDENKEKSSDQILPLLIMQYNWQENQLKAWYEGDPGQLSCKQNDIEILIIKIKEKEKWQLLSTSDADIIKERLKSSTFIYVSDEKNRFARIIVQEIGMEAKPSLRDELSPAEILQYWSLLTPEQKAMFMIQKYQKLLLGKVTELKQSHHDDYVVSIFDSFAGIFHAFGHLNEEIFNNLENKKENPAKILLYGKKADSLPVFIDQVLNNESEEYVEDYIKLLCARESYTQAEKKYPEFVNKYLSHHKDIIKKLNNLEEIKKNLNFSDEKEKIRFLEWFEESFFMEVKK